jgi:hypothetical protein
LLPDTENQVDGDGTNGSGDSVGPNPDETLADLSSPLNDINDIMEWQEILNSVAREEADVRDEDVALLGNCDSEDEEDLDVAFSASHAESRCTWKIMKQPMTMMMLLWLTTTILQLQSWRMEL